MWEHLFNIIHVIVIVNVIVICVFIVIVIEYIFFTIFEIVDVGKSEPLQYHSWLPRRYLLTPLFSPGMDFPTSIVDATEVRGPKKRVYWWFGDFLVSVLAPVLLAVVCYDKLYTISGWSILSNIILSFLLLSFLIWPVLSFLVLSFCQFCHFLSSNSDNGVISHI